MKIQTQLQDDHQAKLTVEIEAEMLEGAKRKAARKLANRIKIPGFRPGKAPYPIILKQIGEGAILEEALDFVVDEIYPNILFEAEIQAYGPGRLEKVPSMDPLILEFLVPLKPEVLLGDYRSISKTYEKPQISEKDVDQMVENLRDRQAIIEPVDRPAQPGDIVTIRLSGERKNITEGQQLTLIRDQSVQILILEDESSDEWPYAGFSRELVGLEAGNEKILEYMYPKNASTENLSGVEAIFRLKVENVKSRTLPELNDEFATSIGEYETLESLRIEIQKSLQEQAEHEYDESYEEDVLREATSQATVKFPAQMLEHEVDDMIENLKSRLEKQKMDMDLYLKVRSMDMDGLRKEIEPVAEARLKNSLVLIEIAKAEKIVLDPDEVQTETLNTMNALSGMVSKLEVRRFSDKNVVQNLMSNVMADMMTHKASERLRMIASGKLTEIENAAEHIANENTEAILSEVEGVEGQSGDSTPVESTASEPAETN